MEDLKALEKKVDRILFYLESDTHTNQKGLVEDVAEMRKELSELIVREKIWHAKAAILGTIGGFAAIFLSWVFDHFIINRK